MTHMPLLLLCLSVVVCVFALLSDLPPIADASGYVEVFRKTILPANGSRNNQITTDNFSSLPSMIPMPTRVAYFLHLNDSWAFVSFGFAGLRNNVTGAPPTIAQLVSLPFVSAQQPHLILHQSINRLNVASSIGNLNASSSSAGALEIWPHCYNGSTYFHRPGASDAFDHDDTPSQEINCYGSFQVHNAANVVLSYCGFTNLPIQLTSGTIGNHASNNSDATYANNMVEHFRVVHCKSLSCHQHQCRQQRQQHHQVHPPLPQPPPRLRPIHRLAIN